MHDDREEAIKRAASTAISYRPSLYRRLCTFFGCTTPEDAPSNLRRSHSQLAPRSVPVALARGVLVATVAACMVAGALFLSLTSREQYSSVLPMGACLLYTSPSPRD